ncbi:type VII toxin-antitoxin system HepT family RNase toxin [Ruania alba]|uniref:Uncharacterized conserved protein YutE, UPF0331/DUF86 family n=1 Tax=Ruania alba TaxID=648782 RepID=A0A1H5BHJ5_9MICO|nr:DUF86 domain-containing protein [Ruania alba]SED54093.1 Uncharacterized conserved protein YutE, UPF0331/DUF86 family [Ruania alba]
MVDPTRLRSILDRVAADIERLEALGTAESETDLDAAKYRLVTAIEGLASAGRHVIGSRGLRGPETYADTFVVLAEVGCLDGETSDVAQRMARFRDLLVHGYAEIDDDQVRQILRSHLGDLKRLVGALAATATR